MSLVLAGLAAFAWGIADFTGGYVSKNNHYLAVTFWRIIFGWALCLVALLFVSSNFYWTDVAWGVAVAIAIAIALPLFYKALADGQMGIVAPLSGTTGAAIPFVVGLALGERPSSTQVVGSVVALVAIFFVSTSHDADAHPDAIRLTLVQRLLRKDVVMGIACGCGFGSSFVAINQMHSDSGLLPYTYIDTMLIVILPLLCWKYGGSLKIRRQDWVLNTGGGLLDTGAALLYLIAVRSGLLSLVGVLSAMFPVITVALAAVVLKEKFTKPHAFGLLLAIVALALIGAG